MPLVRFKIRNELSLGGPELNRSAAVEYEEPKAILGAVEVAGLVGILRQLGDLAEFSAEVFNGIQEEVTVMASRCQKLTSRVKRIESALSPLEKAVLSQTSHIHFAYTAGCEWHPRIRNGQRHFVQSDLPLCVMETYEQCRDPPPLHLLDRFDVGGPGSCLRKYSDPTFFRREFSNPNKSDDTKGQRDQAHRKRKKKRLPQRNICRSRAVSTSDETNGARLSSLTDDRQTTSRSTSTVDMPRSSNMQDLSDIIDQSHLQGQSDAQEESEAQVQSDFRESSKPRDSITGSGYIEYVINQSPVNKPEVKQVEGFLSGSLQPADRIGLAVPEGCIEVVDDNILYSPSEDIPVRCASIVCDEKKETIESRIEESNKDEDASEIHESKFGPVTPDRVRQNQRDFDRTYDFFDEVDILREQQQSKNQAKSIDVKPGVENEGENKSEQGSEADEFVDARNTIESESESELDGVPKPKLEHYFGDISTYCSEDANSDNNDGSEDIPCEQMGEDPHHDNSIDEPCSGSYFPEDANDGSEDANSDNNEGSDDIPYKQMGEGPHHDNSIDEPCSGSYLPEDANDGSEDIAYEQMVEDPHHDSSIDESCSGSSLPQDANVSCWLTNPVYGKTLSHDEKPREFLAMCPSLLAEETFPDVPILQEPVGANSLLAGDCANDNISSEKPMSPGPSLKDAIPAEKTLPEEHLANYLSLAEAVPHEKILPGQSVANYPSSAEIVPHEKILPENSLPKIPSLVKAVPDNMTLAEEPEAAHPSIPKAVQDKKKSPEVFVSKNLSAPEAVSQEKISLEEYVGIDSCLAEATSDERCSPEKPVTTYLSLTKTVANEKVLPKELSETYPSLAELPEEKNLHEDTDDATHPAEAVTDEKISPEVSDYTSVSFEAALPQEQNSLEEFVGINPCLEEAVLDERFLPEDPVTTCLSLKKPAAIEEVLPGKPLEMYPSLAELSQEKTLPEEADDATYPSLSEAASDEQISAEVRDSPNLHVAEAVPQMQVLLEEFVGGDPCLAEDVPDKRVLPEEPITTCMSLTKPVPIVEVLPEEPTEAYGSLEKLAKDKISQEKSDDATHPSSAKAESVSPEVFDSTHLYVAEATPQEQITLEEFIGIDPCLAEAVPDEKVLPEEPVTTCLSLRKAAPIKQILPDEPLEVYPSLEELPEEDICQEEEPEPEPDVATHPSLSEAVGDEKILPVEGPGSIYTSLEESVPIEKTSHEELVGTNPFLELVVPTEMSFPEEPSVTYQSSEEIVSEETNLPEEPLPIYLSLAEAVPDEKISLDEPDAACPSSAEAVSDEKISGSDAPGSTGPHIPEEPVPTDLSLAEAIFDEKIPGSEAPGSTEETSPHNKTFPEEPVPTALSLAEDVFDEKNPGSEAPGSTRETGPHNKTFPEEPVAMDLSMAKDVFDEKIPGSEAPCSTTEAGLHDTTFPEEPVPDDNNLPNEPAATYLDFTEGIPDQKVFLDDAAFLSFAEAIFDQKFSPEVPDSSYPSLREPEMRVAPLSLVTNLPTKYIVEKEGEAYDVSKNQKSGILEPDSADRTFPLSGGTVTISPDTQESLSNGTVVEPVSIWSNGGLLGLAPLKPPVFAEPTSVSEHIQNEINGARKKLESSSRSVEVTEKSSLSLAASQQQSSNMLSHSNGSHSHLQSTPTSFKVFGLSQRLLMAGFRGNSSSTCKFESIPTTSYDTRVAAIEDMTRETHRGSSFEERLDYESSLGGSPTSSPPVEHMNISFKPTDASAVSKLKLRIPCQTQYNGENADMFPSFQLVPEASNSDDDDSDIFCQSSPCVSDNCLSDSELWESDESPRKSVSSLEQDGKRSTHGDMGSFSGSFLDLPCFDSVDHQSTSSRLKQDQEQEQEQDQEQEQVPDYKPSVSEIIRHWPPNKPTSSASNEANAVLNKTQNQSGGL